MSKKTDPLIGQDQYAYKEENENYQGDKLGQEVSLGPVSERSCTDCFFCIVFFCFWVGLLIIAGVAFKNGDPNRLASPFDAGGNHCGYGVTADYKYLLFDQNYGSLNSNYFCVKSCPEDGSGTADCYQYSTSVSCPANYKTNTVVYICVSDSASSFIIDSSKIGWIQKGMSDIEHTWQIQLAVAGITLAISIVLLLLIKFFAGCVIWCVILLYFALLSCLGAYCFYVANGHDMTDLPKQLQDRKLLKAIGVIFFVLDGICLILFFCLLNKIKKAVAIMKAASDFVKEYCSIIFVPIIKFIIVLGFFAFWIAVSLYIYSSGEISYKSGSPFGHIKWDNGVKRSLVYYLFGLFWNCEFIIAASQFIIAGSCSFWYFSHLPGANFHHPILTNFKRAFVYHVGSLCLGSLIIAIVTMIKLIINIIYSSMKSRSKKGSEGLNCLSLCCLRCAKCCVSCFERFIRFISENAFIMMALTGKNFCKSAYDAFYLILRNVAQFGVTQFIGKLFCLLGTCFITAAGTSCGYYIITTQSKYKDAIYSPAFPTILFGIISFVIGYIFMSVYGMAADTLLFCLCVDKELSAGNAKSAPNSVKYFEKEYMN